MANAHDPKEHMKDAKNPDCAAMKDMDHEKMDMEDPVTVAIMSHCMNSIAHAETTDVDETDSQSDHAHAEAVTVSAAPTPTEHQH